jgi:hypothetical protein
MFSKLMPTLAAAAAAIALLAAGPAHAASPTTITACVKTKTGAVKVLTTAKAKKKKCAKGYKKMTWVTTGVAGKDGKNGASGTNGKDGTNGSNGTNGANGTPAAVLSATGNVVGLQLGLLSAGPISLYYVLADGGIWTYAGNGQLFPSMVASPVLFTDPACSGQPSLAIDAVNAAFVASQYRLVLRPIDTVTGAYGTPRAWKLGVAAGTQQAGQTYYSQDFAGLCSPYTAHTGDPLFSLTPVAVPADVPGPLTVA